MNKGNKMINTSHYRLYYQYYKQVFKNHDVLFFMLVKTLSWYTGYSVNSLIGKSNSNEDIDSFFLHAPRLNPYRLNVSQLNIDFFKTDNSDTLEIEILSKILDNVVKNKNLNCIYSYQEFDI